jgi:hypothetical protein
MPGYLVGQPGPGPYDSPAVTPSLPGAATPATAAPRPYAAPVDPHAAAAAGDPLGAPTPTVPVGGYAEPHHSSGSQYGTASQDSIDPLTQPGPGLSDPLDEPSRPGYEDRR